MQSSSPVSHASLEHTLRSANAEGSASEAHGLLAGSICAGGNALQASWLDHLLGEHAAGAAVSSTSNQLDALSDDVLCQFNDDAFGFDLLLPPDEAPLAERTEALGQWCAGFLYGLALGGFRESTGLPDNVSEVMKDFYEISHARFACETTDDTEETAFIEIVEYVRMSVLLLHEELQPVPANTRLQ